MAHDLMSLPSVMTSSDLARHGVSNDLAERRATARVWQRGARGIYLTHAQPPSDAELVEIARRHVGEEFVVSGTVVLRALELPWLPAERTIHVLVPLHVRRSSSRLVRVTRVRRYGELQTWMRYGARFADAARATVDAARAQQRLRDVRGVVLGAVAKPCCSPDELGTALRSGSRNGSALVRRAVKDARRGCASPPEAEVVDELVGRGVPFYVNPELWVDGELVGISDVWLVGTGTGGEIESQEWHGDDATIETTYDRHERYADQRLQLVHLSVRRVRADTREAVEHLLTRARTGPPAPPGLVVVPRGPLLH